MSLSKGKEIKYSSLQMQSYLQPGCNISIEIRRKILGLRLRDIDLKGNFSKAYSDIYCQIPNCNEIETQRHVFYSTCIQSTNIQQQKEVIEYEEIFQNNVVVQTIVARIIYANIEKRKQIFPSNVNNEGPEEPRT